MREALHAINLLRFAMGSHRPIVGPAKVTWEATYRCNSRCRHCHIWQIRDHSAELTSQQAERMIRELAACGVLQISFTGGETFLRRDIFDMIELAAGLGLSTSVNTNGLLLGSVGARLLESPLRAVYISLDGATPETHDGIRGLPGAFEKALEAVRFLRQNRRGSRPRIFANITGTADNCRETADAVRVAIENGADGATLVVAQSQGKFTPDSEAVPTCEHVREIEEQVASIKSAYMRFIPHPAEYLDNFKTYVQDPKQLYRYKCVAGFGTALIKPDGEVCACPTGDFPIGNVKDAPFRDIWFSDTADEMRRAIREDRHPICWTDCVAPLSIVATYLKPWRLPRLLSPAVLKHVVWKLRA